jgi:hypothetical protein
MLFGAASDPRYAQVRRASPADRWRPDAPSFELLRGPLVGAVLPVESYPPSRSQSDLRLSIKGSRDGGREGKIGSSPQIQVRGRKKCECFRTNHPALPGREPNKESDRWISKRLVRCEVPWGTVVHRGPAVPPAAYMLSVDAGHSLVSRTVNKEPAQAQGG